MSLGDTNASGTEGQLVVPGGRGGRLTVCVMARDTEVATPLCCQGVMRSRARVLVAFFTDGLAEVRQDRATEAPSRSSTYAVLWQPAAQPVLDALVHFWNRFI